MNFKLPTQIMFAMLLGVIVGILFREHALIFEPLGNVFIRLLKMIIVPIIFSSLVVGVVSLGSVQSLGRLGMRTFLYYMVTTIMAVMIGLIVVNFIKPGFDTDVDLALFSSNPIYLRYELYLVRQNSFGASGIVSVSHASLLNKENPGGHCSSS